MLRKLVALAVLCVAGMASIPAQAQSFSIVELPGGCGTGNITSNSLSYLTVDSGLKLCVNATATLGGFTALTNGTPISVTTGGVSGTLPAGAEVVATNVGTTNGAYCALGASATTSSQYIAPNGGWFAFAVGASTQLTCITSTSTTTVNTTGGAGLPTGTGGGGGGSSSNASVSATGSGVPASATYAGMNVSGNLTGLTGTANGLKVDGSAVTQPESIASGQVASGAYASGSIASGALAAGSISNGASVAQGSTTDVPCTLPATATACSEIAAQKAIANAVNGPSVGLAGTTPTTSTPVLTGANSQIQTDLHGNIYIAPSQVVTTGGATTANSVPMVANSQYPVNSVTTSPTPLVAKGTGSTGAVTGTLTPGSTATAYVCGFNVSYVGGTAQVGPLVLSGLLGGSFTYQIPVATATGGQTFTQTFSPCLPASAVNTALVMTTVADGTATAVDVNIWGYGL